MFYFAAVNTGEYYCKIMWTIHEVLSTPPQALTVSSGTTGLLFIFQYINNNRLRRVYRTEEISSVIKVKYVGIYILFYFRDIYIT
jgi:hypothetical protein